MCEHLTAITDGFLAALQSKAEYAPYYKNSLLYLACIDPAKDLTTEERLLRAHDLGIAAFLGDTIYNFGELVRRQSLLPYLAARRSLRSTTAHASHPRCARWHSPRMD